MADKDDFADMFRVVVPDDARALEAERRAYLRELAGERHRSVPVTPLRGVLDLSGTLERPDPATGTAGQHLAQAIEVIRLEARTIEALVEHLARYEKALY